MNNSPTVDTIISRLRPRDVGGIIDQAFRLYRRHFWTFLAIVAVVYVPAQLLLQVLSAYLTGSSSRRISPFGGGFSTGRSYSELSTLGAAGSTLGLLILLLSFLVEYFCQSALTAAVADSYLDRPVSFSNAYRATVLKLRKLLGFIGLQALLVCGIFLLILAPVLLVAAPGNSTAALTALACGTCLFIPVLCFYLYLYVRWIGAVPAIMVEDAGSVQAMRRSWGLTYNYWWRTLGIILLLGVINIVISIGPALLIVVLTLTVIPTDAFFGQVLSGAISTFASALFLPLQLIAFTLYYFDLRVRKEGFDLDAAMRQAYQYGQGQYAYGYGDYPPAPGYGAYGQPAPNQYGQYPQAQGQGQGQPQPNPIYPPVLGYEQQGQQTQPVQPAQPGAYPYGYPPAQPGGQYPVYPPGEGGVPRQYPAQAEYGANPAAQPQETVDLDSTPATPSPTESAPAATPSASSETATPYGNDPLGLYSQPGEEQAGEAEEPRLPGPTTPAEGETPGGGSDGGAPPEKREPEV